MPTKQCRERNVCKDVEGALTALSSLGAPRWRCWAAFRYSQRDNPSFGVSLPSLLAHCAVGVVVVLLGPGSRSFPGSGPWAVASALAPSRFLPFTAGAASFLCPNNRSMKSASLQPTTVLLHKIYQGREGSLLKQRLQTPPPPFDSGKTKIDYNISHFYFQWYISYKINVVFERSCVFTNAIVYSKHGFLGGVRDG